jgi:flagellar motor switch protein FliM
MSTVLRFDSAERDASGRWVRPARFVPESSLSLATICLVANGIRERFAAKLGSGIEVDAFEPVVVTREVLDRLLPETTIFRVDAGGGTFWLLLRARTVAGLLAAAFGAEAGQRAELSSLELRTLRRMAKELAFLCAPIYGEITQLTPTHEYRPMYQAASYFEIRVNLAQPISLGLLLARDPDEAGGAGIEPIHLAEIPLTVRANVGSCVLTLEELGGLEIGDILPMIRGESAQLMTGNVALAHGLCGSADGRSAFLASALRDAQ